MTLKLMKNLSGHKARQQSQRDMSRHKDEAPLKEAVMLKAQRSTTSTDDLDDKGRFISFHYCLIYSGCSLNI